MDLLTGDANKIVIHPNGDPAEFDIDALLAVAR